MSNPDTFRIGDKLLVHPLQEVCKIYRSNVSTSYQVVVQDNTEEYLKTFMEGGDARVFDKHTKEWRNGHRFRFEIIK